MTEASYLNLTETTHLNLALTQNLYFLVTQCLQIPSCTAKDPSNSHHRRRRKCDESPCVTEAQIHTVTDKVLGCGGTVDFTYNVLVKGFAGSMTAELANTVKQMPAVSNVQES